MGTSPLPGSLHHVELRVADLSKAAPSWNCILTCLGYVEFQRWPEGVSWILGSTYIVIEQAPMPRAHDRREAGISHLAFHAGGRKRVDEIWATAPNHGWARLYEERHPWAGGEPDQDQPGHYAAFLENDERFKVELVASDAT